MTGPHEASEEPVSGAEPPSDRGTLAGRTVTAAQWQLASSVVRGVLQFGVTVLLARLLTPADFGLVALALIVVGFAEMVVDLGLGPALVQREELTETHLRVSFTVSSLIGAAVAVVVVLAAPLFGPLLQNEAVPAVLRWEALIFLFAGLGATARALLERRLDFRGIFFVDLVSYGLGYAVVAVTLALLGFGPWSLVFGSLVQWLLQSGGALALVRHPMRPLIERGALRDLLGFGLGVLANRGVVYFSINGDNFVVGRWLGVAALGLYNRAFQLMKLPLTYVGNITWKVLFAAYSRVQADRERAARAYLKGVQLTALVVAPIMTGMVIAGPHLIVGLYGPQWVAATLPLQILCAVGTLRAVYVATGALTHAMGKVYAEFRRQAVYAVLVVLASLAGTAWGLTGVAVGVAVSIVYMYFAMAQLGLRLTGCSWREFLLSQVPGAVLAGVVAVAALAVRVVLERQGWGSAVILAAVILASAAAVPVGLYLIPERVRPVELFRTLDGVVARLPGILRLPIRRAMRVPPEHVHAPS